MKCTVALLGSIFLAVFVSSCVSKPVSPQVQENHKVKPESTALFVAQFSTARTQDGIEDSVEEARADDEYASKNCENVVPLEKPKRLPSLVQRSSQDKKLEPGEKAPTFTLPDLNGLEVSLDDLSRKRDVVLIDFWASWCGPCIEQFPALKRLHSEYYDDGFEIVSISVDKEHDSWINSSEKHKLPWTNLGEITTEGTKGPTPRTYGVSGIPRSFLIDTQGCILHTDIDTSELQSFLDKRYADET